MDEKICAKLVKDVVSEELKIVRAEMATKEDFKAFATKEDLKAFATKDDFFSFEARMTSTLENIRKGVQISLFEGEQELREIKSKQRFYNFDYIVKQSDALIKALKDLYEEKTFTIHRQNEHDERLTCIEQLSTS